MIIVEECRYCDGTNKGHSYGKEEPLFCLTCGAEWDPIEVEYPENYLDDLDDDYEEDDEYGNS